MAVLSEILNRTVILRMAALGVICLSLAKCDASPPKDIFAIGIAAQETKGPEKPMEGFKSYMAQHDHVEGRDIAYLYETIPNDKLNDNQFIDSKLRKLFARNPDLLLVFEKRISDRAKVLTEGTGKPVLFSGGVDPVRLGYVKSLDHPDGNFTGVKFADCIPKALEWLESIVGAKKVFVPYNPDDDVSIIALKTLDEAADKLRVELVLQEVYSVAEAVVAIMNLTKDVDAVFLLPSPTLDSKSSELSRAAIERRLPTSTPLVLDDTILATVANDEFDMGGKLARLAIQIEKGMKPSELPVETGDIFLTINLKTAEQIGLHLPDEALFQVKKIIR